MKVIKTKQLYIVFFVILIIIAVSINWLFFSSSENFRETESPTSTELNTHIHADISAYINNKLVDLTEDGHLESKHIHDEETHNLFEGGILRSPTEPTTLGEFLLSAGVQITNTCIMLDIDKEYCNNEKNTLRMYVNSDRERDIENFIFKDLDRIMIVYGPPGEIVPQFIGTTTNRACIYSGTCEAGIHEDNN